MGVGMCMLPHGAGKSMAQRWPQWTGETSNGRYGGKNEETVRSCSRNVISEVLLLKFSTFLSCDGRCLCPRSQIISRL